MRKKIPPLLIPMYTMNTIAAHAISKSGQDFQNRIPRELDKNFYIPRISMINWIKYNFLIYKSAIEKSFADS